MKTETQNPKTPKTKRSPISHTEKAVECGWDEEEKSALDKKSIVAGFAVSNDYDYTIHLVHETDERTIT